MSEYNGQCCAHLRVRYLTREQDKATFGWWACEDCQHQFVPLAMAEYQAREIAELRQDVARHLEIATREISYDDALRARAEALQSKLDAYEHK